MKKLKVLFIAQWFPEGNNYSGIFIKEHALAISKFCDIAVIHGKGKKWQKKRYNFFLSEEDGLKVLRFTYRKIPFLSSYYTYVKGVILGYKKLISEGFTPVIVHANVYPTGIPAYIIKKKYTIPYIIAEHSSGYGLKKLNKKDIKIAKVGLCNAEYILPVSEALKNDILSYGIKGKFVIIPNAVPDYFYYKAKNKLVSNIKSILCVTSMNSNKNITSLIKAVKIIHKIRQNWKLDIVGEGEKMDEYKEIVHNLSLDDFIHFYGKRDKIEIAKMMQRSDFFVLSSKYETFGCVVAEALSSGLPVVAPKVGGLPEMINKNNGILVEPENPEALAKAMLYMMDNLDKYDKESISADAKKKYSYETVSKQIISIYENILNLNH